MVHSQYVTWIDIENSVQIVSKKILNLSKNFSSISTVSRGGLIPSRLLADSLGIEKIFVDQKTISSESLVVDDIFDTGKTFSNLLSKASNPSEFTFVTLFARRGMNFPEQLIYGNQT
ncbi:MAG: phosphoribosyltransferase, partial [Nitrosopumilus sp.]